MTEQPTRVDLERHLFELEAELERLRQAEEALRESREILAGVLRALPVRIFWKDRNLVYLGCNDAFARDAGAEDPADIIGKSDQLMVWHEQAAAYGGDDREVIETGVPKLLIEETQTTPSGTEITLLTSKVPLRDTHGEVTGVLGTYMDITERKRLEVALDEERRRLELALDDIKTLRGILPICSHCKKIRDDEGAWNQLEKYVSAHSDARFSHGICPDCVAELYPELLDDV